MHSERGNMMIELYQLEQLVTIAKKGTLSKAAEVLLISQPALTRSIQKLEYDLGLKLFDRKKNKMTLNDNGELAIQYATSILDEVNHMVNQLQIYDRSKHMISLASCAPAPIWGLQPIITRLYPEMKFSDELQSDEKILIKGLKEYRYSLIVLNHLIEDDDFICYALFEEKLYLSLPPAHPLSLFNEISFADLNGESILLLSKIGFWNEICLKKLPDSHLLVQEDESVFNELKKASALPTFRTNITIQREKHNENRVYVPICDPEAKVNYYLYFLKENQQLFKPLKNEVINIQWNNK